MDFEVLVFFCKKPLKPRFLKTPILQPWVHARLRVNNITRDIVGADESVPRQDG